MSASGIDMIYNIRDAILCVGFLAGIIVGVVLMVRRHILAGFLTISAFILFGLEPITDFIVFRVLYTQNLSDAAYTALDYAYPCISAPTICIGSLLLVVAFILVMRDNKPPAASQPPAPPPPPPAAELIPPPDAPVTFVPTPPAAGE
jgi:hypothetical protein